MIDIKPIRYIPQCDGIQLRVPMDFVVVVAVGTVVVALGVGTQP
jgi:hypothetical protein